MKGIKAIPSLLCFFLLTGCGSGTGSSEDLSSASFSSGSVSSETGSSDSSPYQDGIEFGNYIQDGNAPAPIRWKVLKEEDDKVLLLSDKVLDSYPYNSKRESITWDRSDIRKWLNSDFLTTAFTSEEQEKILLSELKNDDDKHYGTPVGEDTEDKVFLLSAGEVDAYLPNEGDRLVSATRQAVNNGVYVNDDDECAWWLRSPGANQYSPSYLASRGNYGNGGHDATDRSIGTRPALWLRK